MRFGGTWFTSLRSGSVRSLSCIWTYALEVLYIGSSRSLYQGVAFQYFNRFLHLDRRSHAARTYRTTRIHSLACGLPIASPTSEVCESTGCRLHFTNKILTKPVSMCGPFFWHHAKHFLCWKLFPCSPKEKCPVDGRIRCHSSRSLDGASMLQAMSSFLHIASHSI